MFFFICLVCGNTMQVISTEIVVLNHIGFLCISIILLETISYFDIFWNMPSSRGKNPKLLEVTYSTICIKTDSSSQCQYNTMPMSKNYKYNVNRILNLTRMNTNCLYNFGAANANRPANLISEIIDYGPHDQYARAVWSGLLLLHYLLLSCLMHPAYIPLRHHTHPVRYWLQINIY